MNKIKQQGNKFFIKLVDAPKQDLELQTGANFLYLKYDAGSDMHYYHKGVQDLSSDKSTMQKIHRYLKRSLIR